MHCSSANLGTWLVGSGTFTSHYFCRIVETKDFMGNKFELLSGKPQTRFFSITPLWGLFKIYLKDCRWGGGERASMHTSRWSVRQREKAVPC